MARAERGRNGRHDPSECRCLCGSLVARLVSGGVELKCRRCKRTVLVPLIDLARSPAPRTGSRAVNLQPTPCGQRPSSPEPCRLNPSPELAS